MTGAMGHSVIFRKKRIAIRHAVLSRFAELQDLQQAARLLGSSPRVLSTASGIK